MVQAKPFVENEIDASGLIMQEVLKAVFSLFLVLFIPLNASWADENPDLKKMMTQAESGDIEAQKALAREFEKGIGVAANSQALKWWKEAAKSGDDEACIKSARLLMGGYGLDKNLSEAVAILRGATASDSVKILLALAQVLDDQSNKHEATEFYLKAAKKGDGSSAYILAQRYYLGEGTKPNIQKAFVWAKIATARKCHDAERLANQIQTTMNDKDLLAAKKIIDRLFNK